MNRITRRRALPLALFATALVALGSATVGVSAKELGSGRRTTTVATTTTTCNPVQDLRYRGDATTSDTGAATITIEHKVRSCNGEPVTVEVILFETADPSVVAYVDTDAPLAARVTVGGVTANRSYLARVVVRATDGTELGRAQIYAAAILKGV